VEVYKNLVKLMQYLYRTRELRLTIEPNYHPSWWVDSSYTIHPIMRSHSGIFMTLGKGVTYSTYSKQKLKTKSSTKEELVAIDDSMAQVLWIKFMHRRDILQTHNDNIPR